MDVTEDIREKVIEAQINSGQAAIRSDVAATESVRTNRKIDQGRIGFIITVITIVGSFLVFWWGAAQWCADIRSTQLQQNHDIQTHNLRFDQVDLRFNNIDSKMEHMSHSIDHVGGVIDAWSDGPLQPIKTQRHNRSRLRNAEENTK